MLRQLEHQGHQPDDAEGDVQPVRADEGEEARQEGAALRPRADLDQMVEFVKLDPEEGERSEEHTSELQSLMRISYAVFCLKKKTHKNLIDSILTTQS